MFALLQSPLRGFFCVCHIKCSLILVVEFLILGLGCFQTGHLILQKSSCQILETKDTKSRPKCVHWPGQRDQKLQLGRRKERSKFFQAIEVCGTGPPVRQPSWSGQNLGLRALSWEDKGKHQQKHAYKRTYQKITGIFSVSAPPA